DAAHPARRSGDHRNTVRKLWLIVIHHSQIPIVAVRSTIRPDSSREVNPALRDRCDYCHTQAKLAGIS
ncbi:MAG: hypothetical protein WCD67_23030, partial [Xanthobacteraceae bacterium]